MSSIDKFYRVSRSTVLPMFAGGWGDPITIKKLIEKKHVYTDQTGLKGFISANQPNIKIIKKEVGKTYILKEGEFETPFDKFLPGLMNKNNSISRFQIIQPTEWPTKYRPIVIHLAGTGDHNYWSRKWLLAYSLLKEGIGSILLVNPYYGERKPKDQRFSSLKYVSDLFIMGGSLIMECQCLLNWCGDHHYGPFAIHGISMGGFMASLAGCVWPHPISIIPCLSWTTASPVFVDGVISTSVCWKKLSEDYYKDVAFSKEIRSLIQPSFPQEFLLPPLCDTADVDVESTPSQFASIYNVSADIAEKSKQSLFYLMNRIYPTTQKTKVDEVEEEEESESDDYSLEEKDNIEIKLKETDDAERIDVINLKKQAVKSLSREEEVQAFMRELLDSFTHIGEYSMPIDNRLIVLVSAENDAYVPRVPRVIPVDQIWPGCEVRNLKGMGHVGAYIRNAPIFGRTDFRDAIRDSFNLQLKLHYGERDCVFPNPDNKDKNPKPIRKTS